MNDKISIIVPVYNVEEYLVECLDSLINQTYKNIEIILVNDGSKDNSPKICDDYARKDNRIKVIHKENGGVSSARNTGIKNASGKYICFVDSDDIVLKCYVSRMYEQIKKYKVKYVIFGHSKNYSIIEENSKIKYNIHLINKESKKFSNLIIREKINSPYCKLFDLQHIKSNKLFFDERVCIGEDFLFNMEYLKEIDQVCFSDEPIYWYRKGMTNSLSEKFNPNKFDNLIYVINEVNYIYDIKKNNDYRNIYDALQAIKIKNIYSCYKDQIVLKKVNEKSFVNFANNCFIGKIKVKFRFHLFFIESCFYNCKRFKEIYIIIKKKRGI